MIPYGIILERIEASGMNFFTTDVWQLNIFLNTEKVLFFFFTLLYNFLFISPTPGSIVNHLVNSLERTDIN